MTTETVYPAPGSSPASGNFSAFVVERSGDSIAAGIRTFSVDDLPAGEVLLHVDWSAVNYKDGMVAQPGNRVARISPLVPGVDLVGTVVTGSGYDAGQPVIVHGYDLGVAHHGGFAEYARVPADWWCPFPTGSVPGMRPSSEPRCSPLRCRSGAWRSTV